MTETTLFERLEQAINLIARHPFYPGKQDAVADCREDLEERVRGGSLTRDQKARLVAILESADQVESGSRRPVAVARPRS
jgi:hypothetical protein